MIIARVLRTMDGPGGQENNRTGRRLIVKEMDIHIRQYKGMPLTAEDAVGAAAGDLVLCSESRGSGGLMAVGIVDTVELVGTKVYDKNIRRRASEDSFRKMVTH